MTRDEAVTAARTRALARLDGGMVVLVAFMASDLSRSRSARAKTKVRTVTGAWLSVDPGRLALLDDPDDLARMTPLFDHLRKATPCV